MQYTSDAYNSQWRGKYERCVNIYDIYIYIYIWVYHIYICIFILIYVSVSVNSGQSDENSFILDEESIWLPLNTFKETNLLERLTVYIV